MVTIHAEDWFTVYKGPFFEDESEEEPDVTGAPAVFLRQLRDMIPTWRSFDVTDNDTLACYENERLRIVVNISDSEAKAVVGCLRVEVSDHDWQAAWVAPSRGIGDPSMADADPHDSAGGSAATEQGVVDEAVGWLLAQLQRPITRYVWRDRGRVVAEDWRLTDSGRPLVGSGSRELLNGPLEAADAAIQVRP